MALRKSVYSRDNFLSNGDTDVTLRPCYIGKSMVIHYNSNASIFFSIIIVVTYLYREIIYLEITQLWSTTKVVFFSLETIWKESIYRGRISSSWTSFAFIRFFYHLYKPFRLEFRKANGLDPVSIRNSGGLRGFKTWMGGRERRR